MLSLIHRWSAQIRFLNGALLIGKDQRTVITPQLRSRSALFRLNLILLRQILPVEHSVVSFMPNQEAFNHFRSLCSPNHFYVYLFATGLLQRCDIERDEFIAEKTLFVESVSIIPTNNLLA